MVDKLLCILVSKPYIVLTPLLMRQGLAQQPGSAADVLRPTNEYTDTIFSLTIPQVLFQRLSTPPHS